MKTLVLAYSGSLASSVAIPWLAAAGADVVTVTLDVGQESDPAGLRARALACGARRAEVVDAREDVARAGMRRPADGAMLGAQGLPLRAVTHALVARALVETAAREGTAVVAHGARDTALDAAVGALDPRLVVRAPAREWHMSGAEIAAYARARGIAVPAGAGGRAIEQDLWGRLVRWREGGGLPGPAPAAARGAPVEPARLEIAFDGGLAVAVNGVPMAPAELVESVALIAGRHGIGHLELGGDDGQRVVYDAPAAAVLAAARAAMGIHADGVVRLLLAEGGCAVVGAGSDSAQVTHA